MASDEEREAALRAFDGSPEGRAAVERRVRPISIIKQDSRLMGASVACLYALMQLEPAERLIVLEWLRSQAE